MNHKVHAGAALLCFTLTACAKEPQTAAPAPAVVTVVTSDTSFTLPDTVQSGLTIVRMVNGGTELHHVQIVRLDSGMSIDSLKAGLGRPGPMPAHTTWLGGPQAVIPGDTSDAASVLTPGNYAVLCIIGNAQGPHFMHGMLRPLTVVPASGAVATTMASDVEVRLADFDFTFAPALTAGRHTLHVTNRGPMPHELIIVQLAPGKTKDSLLAWVGGGMNGPPPGRPMGGIVALQAGSEAWVMRDFPAGRYALLCFLPDDKGKEHITRGMATEISVE